MSASLEIWGSLLDAANASLVADAEMVDPTSVAAVEGLRARHKGPPERIHAALQLALARRKARAKWPSSVADRLLADPEGVEMASSALAGWWKSSRITRVDPSCRFILDLCCGIGGDAMALRSGGFDVLAVDVDPVRAAMCAANARCQTRVCDVLDPGLPEGPFLLDPARRVMGANGRQSGGAGARGLSRRVFDLDDHRPGPPVWQALIRERHTGVIKLGPGADVGAVAAALPAESDYEIEILSERGRLTQMLVWIGRWVELDTHRRGRRTATLVNGIDDATSVRGDPGESGDPPIGPMGRYLVEADAAIERAELLDVACRGTSLHGLAPGLGLLTADEPVRGPMFTSFEVLARMPWIEKHVRAWLRGHDAGIVEVKTRGRAVDPDAVQRRLRGEGGAAYTVFILRFGRAIEAVVTRRDGYPWA